VRAGLLTFDGAVHGYDINPGRRGGPTRLSFPLSFKLTQH
jgi:hypothetical protein